ncbi:piggyBac transposable element-derived protein 4-like [Portunus trituberculatus]|uniref:piggyBac transposable element-derived protein 4-like n=1 Tax=Portunus trituberculatus TaxID=210409 RepID=UPI001E1CD5E1|nr:piggyBac transposable element-derived protein 4-like [Portunus trituberculatus]
MGIVGMPEISSYWSKSKLYAGSYISSVMTREKFEILLRCIHFRDNSDVDDPLDPLFKVRPLVTAIRDCCQAVYKPGPMVVIDESMVPFRGRSKVRQYIPGKAHKYGFKLYKVCTPSGYTWNFKIHSGSQTKHQGLNSTESLTVELCEELLDMGATLYADNYYCSLTLAEYLLKKKTYLCGTLSSTRQYLPKEVTESKKKKNEMKGRENSNGVKVFKWRDKRNVLTISTVSEHSDQLVPSGKVNRCREEVFKPQSVMAYNKAKKGVDVFDQYTSYYSLLRKGKKWYRKLAFELLTGLTVVNAWVLHCQYFPRAKMSQLQFRVFIVFPHWRRA